MTVRLTVDERAWRAQIAVVAAETIGLAPVVKGSGYGFGRTTLMPHAAALSEEIAVGTVFEVDDVPADRAPVVLTPTLDLPTGLRSDAILTVGSLDHVERLRALDRRGRVVVKLASTMLRYGALPGDLDSLLDRCSTARLEVVGFAIHLPLAGSDDDRLAEVLRWLPLLPRGPLWVSHLGPDAQRRLDAIAGQRPIRVRIGTALWHGDKSALRLGADVTEVREVTDGALAGYRATPVPGDGHVVLAGAGSAHGVAALDDGRSPFHFARRRLTMLEPPHMHTTMLFVPAGDPLPAVGDVLDLQRPLITTTVDQVRWA